MRPAGSSISRSFRAHFILRPAPGRPQFSHRRFQSQVVQNEDGQTLQRRDVRFKKPPMLNWRRIVTVCMYGASVYLTLKYIPRLAGFDISVEVAEAEEQQTATKEDREDEVGIGIEVTDEDLEAAEDSFFIPMTWAQKLPRTYYKGTDPEWQEFVKIGSSKERKNEVMREFVMLFARLASKNPQITRRLGGDIRPAKSWLDIAYPEGPPQEYVRSGLEFGDGYIAWSRQRIQGDKQHRIARALWPKAVFESAYAVMRTFIRMQWHQLSHALNLSTDDEYMRKFKAAAARMKKSSRDPAALPKAQTDPDNSATSGEPSAGSASKQYDPEDNAQKALWPFGAVRLSGQREETDEDRESKLKIAIAASVFVRSLVKGWHAKQIDPPRGTIVLHGILELHGKNGRMSFEVQGLYDPKQRKYSTLNADLRTFIPWRQVPRGGP